MGSGCWRYIQKWRIIHLHICLLARPCLRPRVQPVLRFHFLDALTRSHIKEPFWEHTFRNYILWDIYTKRKANPILHIPLQACMCQMHSTKKNKGILIAIYHAKQQNHISSFKTITSPFTQQGLDFLKQFLPIRRREKKPLVLKNKENCRKAVNPVGISVVFALESK